MGFRSTIAVETKLRPRDLLWGACHAARPCQQHAHGIVLLAARCGYKTYLRDLTQQITSTEPKSKKPVNLWRDHIVAARETTGSDAPRGALHIAVEQGHVDTVDFLVGVGCACALPATDDGTTPLLLAVRKGDLACVNALLKCRDARDGILKADTNGTTPLIAAAGRAHIAMLQRMTEHARFVFRRSMNEAAAEEAQDEESYALQATRATRRSNRLHRNVARFHNSASAGRRRGQTPRRHRQQQEAKGSAREDDGNNDDNDDYDDDLLLQTALNNAIVVGATSGNASVVEALLELGAHVNARDSNGVNLLTRASGRGHVDVVQVLLNANAPLEAQTESGKTALFAACEGGHARVVEVLLEANACHRRATHRNKTPLYVAAEQADVPCLRAILKYCDATDLYTETTYGTTPVYIACKQGNGAVVKLLMATVAPQTETDTPGVRDSGNRSGKDDDLILPFVPVERTVTITDHSNARIVFARPGFSPRLSPLSTNNQADSTVTSRSPATDADTDPNRGGSSCGHDSVSIPAARQKTIDQKVIGQRAERKAQPPSKRRAALRNASTRPGVIASTPMFSNAFQCVNHLYEQAGTTQAQHTQPQQRDEHTLPPAFSPGLPESAAPVPASQFILDLPGATHWYNTANDNLNNLNNNNNSSGNDKINRSGDSSRSSSRSSTKKQRIRRGNTRPKFASWASSTLLSATNSSICSGSGAKSKAVDSISSISARVKRVQLKSKSNAGDTSSWSRGKSKAQNSARKSEQHQQNGQRAKEERMLETQQILQVQQSRRS
jgi:ankyrin repeat protein